MTRRRVLLGAVACVGSAVACHGPLARRRQPEPTPPVATAKPVTPPVPSDAVWIDSVTRSWTVASAQPLVASTTKTRAGRYVAASYDTSATPENPVNATSYAEAGLSPNLSAMSGASDDQTPLVILVAIGLIALFVTIEAGRVALRR